MAELRFDVTGDTSGAQRGLKDLAGASDLAAKGARLLADSLDKQKRAASASVGATLAAAKADKILRDASDEAIASFVAEKEAIDADRKAKEENALATDALAKSSKGAAGGVGALGTPMEALVAVGAALAPAIVTIGTGLAGLGIAAAGIVSPVLKAAQGVGGLKANLDKLDPAQQTLAVSLLHLQKTYDAFQKSLEPVLIADFNAAIHAAEPLLRGIQPVAQATGTALEGLFRSVGTTFRSGEWQQFFNFMARTAGPDLQLLTESFTNLLKTLPPLLEQLQPVAVDLLSISAALTKAAEAGVKMSQSSDTTSKHMGALQQIATALKLALFAPGVGLYHALELLHIITPKTGKAIQGAGDNARGATQHFQTLAQQVTNLMNAESKALDTQLAYSNSLITAANDAVSLKQALQASHDKIGLHTAAERASFSAANTYIADLENSAKQAWASGKGIDGQAAAIRRGLPLLDSAKTKNRLYWEEVRTLKDWLDKLRLEPTIREKINVLGIGSWSATAATHKIAQGPGPFASGGRVPGSGNTDSYAAMLTPGEVVVPKGMVSAGAVDHLRGSLPGFAAGGIVPSYSGSVGGLKPWSHSNLNAAAAQILSGIGNAMAAAFHSATTALASFPGGGAVGGSAAQNRAIAMRMFPWPMSQWPSFNYVEMREAGYSLTAQNPTSGAYGMAQFINGPAEYYQWGGNPNTAGGQLTAMFNYIRSRYGTPGAAAAHELSFNWYDKGGQLPVGLSLALNTTGRPEMVGGGGRAGGLTVVVQVDPAIAASTPDARLGQHIAQHVTAALKRGMALYPAGVSPR